MNLAGIKGFLFRGAPKRFVVCYLNGTRILHLFAERSRRVWSLSPVTETVVPAETSIFEALKNLEPSWKRRRRTGVLVFLSPDQCTLHTEHYPSAIQADLDKALVFDRDEIVFLDQERGEAVFGQAVVQGDRLMVPVHTTPLDVLFKIRTALEGKGFTTLTVVPAALVLAGFSGENSRSGFLARLNPENTLELYRTLDSQAVEAMVLKQGSSLVPLARERMSAENAEHLFPMLCEQDKGDPAGWAKALPLTAVVPEEPLLAVMTRTLLAKDRVRAHGDPLDFRPLKMPMDILAGLAFILLVLGLCVYQSQVHGRLTQESAQQKIRKKALEIQLEPILHLQGQIERIRAVDSLRTEQAEKGFPVLGLLRLLTELTPQDTWIQSMQVKGETITLQGESASTVKYLTALSEVAGFKQVSMPSPVRTGPKGRGEIFSVKIEVDPVLLSKTLKACCARDKEAASPPQEGRP